MSAADPMTPESREPSNRLPLAFWIGLVMVALVIVFAILANRSVSGSGNRFFRKNVDELKAGRTDSLQIIGTHNTDSLLEQIRGMPEIENVYIESADITVVGMRHLGTLPNLKRILAYNSVSGDEGLLELRNCTKLESLEIYDRGITNDAIAELQRHIPNVRVFTTHDEESRPHDRVAQRDTDVNPPASDDKPARAAERPEGFEPIFNGRDLTGWEGGAEDWKVEEGCLTGTADGTLKHNRFIVWRGGQVENFELRVQVKVSPGGNSGLQYRGTERPDLGETVVTGYQCDVVAGRADYDGMLYEERGRRILAHTGERVIIDPQGQPWVVGEFKLKSFKPGEWHDFRVLVEGNHHRHWIDGHPTVDVIDLDEKGRKLKGVLGMQVHVGPPMTIQYRNIHLKKLPADLPILSVEDAPIPPDARKVVPQGQDKPRPPDPD